MTDFKNRVRTDWPDSLRRVLELARSHGPKGVLAFDLDSTLFDNRPRQARIVREYGEARGVPELLGCQGHHFDSGWDMKAAVRNCGLSAERAEALYPDLKQFWLERFFTSPYCVDDVAIEGASVFLRAVAGTRAQVCYVTGRHEGMRAGTEESLRLADMPLPGANVRLLMKPTFEMNDDEYKRQAHAQLRTFGTVLAAFDNEPTHANDYRVKFPEATVIHLATDHSGRPVEILDGIVSVPHFNIPL